MTPTGKSPHELMCHTGVVTTTKTSARTGATYDAVVESVQKLIGGLSDSCNDAACPRGEFSACILRMAGHDFMDFNKETGFGGSDGCIDFDDQDNKGLKPCLFTGENGVHLNDAYVKHRKDVSLADFLVIAGEAAMAFQRHARTVGKDKQQLKDVFKKQFNWGRTTRKTCQNQVHLPLPQTSCAANEKTFIKALSLTWRETAALMGVHTLGRARLANSGYDGWWSDPVSSSKFDNNYYHSLAGKGWMPQKTKADKSQWVRAGARSGINTEMMLNTDMCLLYENMHNTKDNTLKAEDFADGGCCAWLMPKTTLRDIQSMSTSPTNPEQNTWCGFNDMGGFLNDNFGVLQNWCCQDAPAGGNKANKANGKTIDCNSAKTPAGPAAKDILEFAVDEEAWLQTFLVAWSKATQRGMKNEILPNLKR